MFLFVCVFVLFFIHGIPGLLEWHSRVIFIYLFFCRKAKSQRSLRPASGPSPSPAGSPSPQTWWSPTEKPTEWSSAWPCCSGWWGWRGARGPWGPEGGSSRRARSACSGLAAPGGGNTTRRVTIGKPASNATEYAKIKLWLTVTI